MEFKNIIKRCQQGDLHAFEALVKKYQSKVMGTAYLITRSTTIAEEVAQDTFYKVYTVIDQLKSAEAFERWLYKIAVNFSRNAIRKKHLLFIPLTEEHKQQIISEDKKPEEELIENESIREIRKAIAGLNVKLRLPIILKFYADLSEQQIADILGCPVGTVKSRLHSARTKLAQML